MAIQPLAPPQYITEKPRVNTSPAIHIQEKPNTIKNYNHDELKDKRPEIKE
jgi:hypothetical protein